MTDELELVRAAVREWGSTEVARQLGATEGAVRHWVSGSSKPRDKARQAIRAAYAAQILPVKSNGHTKVPHVAPSEPPAATVPSKPLEKDEPVDVDASNPAETAIHVLEKLLTALERARGARLASISNAIIRGAQLLAALNGQIELTESQILRSPAWARVRTTVWEALEPFPDAMRAVNDAIAQLDAS